MAEVLRYLPGPGPALLAGDGLEVRELRAIGVLVCSHSPLESPHILYGAVPKLGCTGAEIPYHLRRQVKVAEALHQGVHVT